MGGFLPSLIFSIQICNYTQNMFRQAILLVTYILFVFAQETTTTLDPELPADGQPN